MTQTKTQHLKVTRISSHGDKVYQGIVAEIVWQRLQTILAGLPPFDAIRFGVEAEADHIRYEIVGDNEALWLSAKDGQGEEELYQLLVALASEEGWGLAGGHTYIEVYHPETGEPMGGDFFGNTHGISLSSFHVGDDGVVRVDRGLNVEPRLVDTMDVLDSATIWKDFERVMLAEYAFKGEDYSHEKYWNRFAQTYIEIRQKLRSCVHTSLYHLVESITEDRYETGSVDIEIGSATYYHHEWVTDGYRTTRRRVVHKVQLPEWVSACVQPGAFLKPDFSGVDYQKQYYLERPNWTLRAFFDGMAAYYPLAANVGKR